MTTPLASVGFKLFSPEESLQLATVVAEKGERVSTAKGNYVALTTDTGSQIWAKLDDHKRPYAILPHFKGDSVNTLLLAQRIKYSENALDGRFLAWINPRSNTLGFGGPPGDYTIIFESPNYAFYTYMETPCTVEVQIACLAREVMVFSSVEDYNQYPGKSCPVETVLLPSNTAGNIAANEPEAFICGIVQTTKVFENPLTHYYFQWARVKVQGAFFDVCVDTAILDSPMTPGGVVAGNFNISGLIVV